MLRPLLSAPAIRKRDRTGTEQEEREREISMAVSLFNRAEISFTGKEKKAMVYSSLLLLYTPLSKEKRYAFFSISIPLQQVEFNRASFSVFSKKPFSFSSVASNYRYDYLLALHRERERERE